jgi:protein O-GlcNAc transferase
MKIIFFFFNIYRFIFTNIKYLISNNKVLVPNHNLSKKLIVSLTSKKSRFIFLHLTLMSLFHQKTLPDRIILWIDKKEKKFLNNRILKFCTYGLEIKFCDNLGSYNKIYYMLNNNEDYIITFDDDVIYHNESISKLVNSSLLHGDKFVISNRVHEITCSNNKLLNYKSWKWNSKKTKPSIYNFQTGVYGVLYPPKCFHPDVVNKKSILELCPYADDIWLYWMIRLNKRKVVWSGFDKMNLKNLDFSNKSLHKKNVGNNMNDFQIHNLINKYNFPVD